MEAFLGRIFLILVLVLMTFAFYLQVNAMGVHVPTRLISDPEKVQDEIVCYYFTGVSFQRVTFHHARRWCPTWIDIY